VRREEHPQLRRKGVRPEDDQARRHDEVDAQPGRSGRNARAGLRGTGDFRAWAARGQQGRFRRRRNGRQRCREDRRLRPALRWRTDAGASRLDRSRETRRAQARNAHGSDGPARSGFRHGIRRRLPRRVRNAVEVGATWVAKHHGREIGAALCRLHRTASRTPRGTRLQTGWVRRILARRRILDRWTAACGRGVERQAPETRAAVLVGAHRSAVEALFSPSASSTPEVRGGRVRRRLLEAPRASLRSRDETGNDRGLARRRVCQRLRESGRPLGQTVRVRRPE